MVLNLIESGRRIMRENGNTHQWGDCHPTVAQKEEDMADGVNIPLQEGSVVRVSPEGKRTIHNNGTEPMVVLCVQYRETAFTQDDATDGVILKDQVKW